MSLSYKDILDIVFGPKAQDVAAATAQKKQSGLDQPNRPERHIPMLHQNVVVTSPNGKVEAGFLPAKTRSLDFIKNGFVTFTAVEMNLILRECQYDRQRRIDKVHVATLADIMKRGLWEPRDKLDFGLLDGKLYLLNGYHRAHAQIQVGRPIEWTVVIHQCADESVLRSLYYKFDTNVRKRTAEQILNGIGFAEEHGLSKTVSKSLFQAITFIANDFVVTRGANVDNIANRVIDRRLELAAEYAPAAKVLQQCIEKSQGELRRKILIGGCASVALVTLRYQSRTAPEFWDGVARNDGLRRGDPRHTLVQDILTRRFNSGAARQTVLVPALAWNAWAEGRSIRQIVVQEPTRMRIAGTPWE